MEINKNERIDDLEFDNLKIIQNKDGFCFGVDSILLSDFAKNIKNGAKVVDIGTGTGIIAILLCAKTGLSKIYGIEVQDEVAKMAKRSVKLNNLEDKMDVLNINIKECTNYLEPHSIDAVVSNPPYKKENTGVKNIDKRQLISRHEVECNLEDVIKNSAILLKDLGEFYMVHRAERIVDIMVLLRKYNMEPKIIRFVQSKAKDKPTLILIKAIRCAKEYLKIEKPLIIYNDDGTYTDEIIKIYNKKRD